ncbi:hypothetical protein FRC02_006511 [Tulasnella sp. 418]|nr:hypothetical protein FRC02_006511 [Tulasnella sp. 418]
MNLRSSSSSAVPVTSVFFTSLSFSLTAAFGAVTAKQWLTEYSHVGAMKALPIQGRMRQERYQGMERWHLRLVIELLPVFLQISLLLFLVGVIQFLWDLDRKVGILQLVLSVTGLALYVVTVVIGIAVPTSPFQTPFSRYIPLYLGKSWTKLASAILLAPFTLLGTARAMKAWFNGVSLAGILSFVRSYPPYTGTHPSINTYNEVERRVLNLHTGYTSADVTAAESVVWLLEQAEHPDVILAALDAVPRFPPRLISSLINKREGLLERLVVFHNGLLPIAETGRHNPQRWVKTWSNRAIVSGIALTHISFARMSDTYVMSMANSTYIVERNLDSEPLAVTKFVLNWISACIKDPSDFIFIHGLLPNLTSVVHPSLQRPIYIQVELTDISQGSSGHTFTTSVVPVSLVLDALVSYSFPNIVQGLDKDFQIIRQPTLSFLRDILRGESSHDVVSHVAITAAAIYASWYDHDLSADDHMVDRSLQLYAWIDEEYWRSDKT